MFARPSPDYDGPHVFSIHDAEAIQEMWNKIQKKSCIEVQPVAGNVPLPSESCTTGEPCACEHKPIRFSDEEETAKPFKEFCCASDQPLDQRPLLGEVSNDRITSGISATDAGVLRAHYFNTTDPPQFCDAKGILPNSRDAQTSHDSFPAMSTGLMMTPDAFMAQAGKAESQDSHDMLLPNITVEGKRQAQLAGEKFRARGLHYRARRSSLGQGDRSNYHNRWASYEKPQAFVVSPLEGKRQAQTSAIRLRSRASRVRQGSRGRSDQAIAVDNDGVSETVLVPRSPHHKPEQMDTATSANQKSLLEVFESELAKDPRDCAPTSSSCNQRVSTLPKPTVTDQMNPLASTNHSPPPQPASAAIESGIRTALNGFESCLRGIIDTMKAAQPSRSDQQIMKDSLRFFGGLGEKMASLDTAASDVNTSAARADPEAQSIPSGKQKVDFQLPHMHSSAESWTPAGKETNQSGPLLRPTLMAEASHTQDKTEKSVSGIPSSDILSDSTGPFRYHPPGPIHLPQQNFPQGKPQWSHSTDSPSKPLGYVDHLRGLNSANVQSLPLSAYQHQDFHTSNYTKSDKSASLFDIATRFPTIGQFENGTFSNELAPPAPPPLIDLDLETGNDHSQDTKPCATTIRPESSGQFFNRMAAKYPLKSASSVESSDEHLPHRNAGIGPGSAASKATLLRPFDAFAPEGAPESQHQRGVRRSATVAASNLRRPYSDIFADNARAARWSPASQQRHSTHLSAEASSTSLHLTAMPTMQRKSLPHVNPVNSPAVHRAATIAGVRREANLRPHDAKVRKCVDNLIGLGFDIERSRLRVYASVAGGDLDEAIDIITEDQKVHASRS